MLPAVTALKRGFAACGKKLTNTLVEGFVGGQVYTSGKKAGQPVEHPILWDSMLVGFGVR